MLLPPRGIQSSHRLEGESNCTVVVCCSAVDCLELGDLVMVGKLTTKRTVSSQQETNCSQLEQSLLPECVMYCSVWQAWVQYIII